MERLLLAWIAHSLIISNYELGIIAFIMSMPSPSSQYTVQKPKPHLMISTTMYISTYSIELIGMSTY